MASRGARWHVYSDTMKPMWPQICYPVGRNISQRGSEIPRCDERIISDARGRHVLFQQVDLGAGQCARKQAWTVDLAVVESSAHYAAGFHRFAVGRSHQERAWTIGNASNLRGLFGDD